MSNSLQKIFDKVYLGLAGQGFQKSAEQKNGTDVCLYRYEGLKCAAGHLVPDEEYNFDWDDRVIFRNSLVRHIPWFVKNFSETKLKFIATLQDCHDTSIGTEDMKEKFINVARRYCLTVPG